MITVHAASLFASLFLIAADDAPAPESTSKPADPAALVKDANGLVHKYEYIGEVTGNATSTTNGTIHLKVPVASVKAVNNRNTGNRNNNNNNNAYHRNSHYHSNAAIRTPQVTTKLVDQNYPLSENVIVKSVSGTTGGLNDVKAGQTIRIHIVKVSSAKPGQPWEVRYEVKSIDVASVSANSTTTTPAKAAPAKK